MVQYIFTPWRDRRELLAVRKQFYPSRHSHQPPQHQHQQHQPLQQQRRRLLLQDRRNQGTISTPPSSLSTSKTTEVTNLGKGKAAAEREEMQRAVARVAMWMQRGACPHMVESTALLTAAILSDDSGGGGLGMMGLGPGEGAKGYAVRAAYSAAFSRFVTGLLDSHQDKQRKMSMYDVAKSVGLPATFVELRHQATHEQLPSLTRLRTAARKALDWIWDYYWRHLPEADSSSSSSSGADDPAMRDQQQKAGNDEEEENCRELLVRYLEEEDEGDQGRLLEQIRGCDEGMVLTTLDAISGSTRNSKVLRRAVALTREILERGRDSDRMDEDGDQCEVRLPKDIERVKAELDKAWEEIRQVDQAETKQGEEAVDVEMVDEGPSWRLYEEETWVPKPIGVV